MQRCNSSLILNASGILYDVPCIVTDKVTLNIDSSTYISTLDNHLDKKSCHYDSATCSAM